MGCVRGCLCLCLGSGSGSGSGSASASVFTVTSTVVRGKLFGSHNLHFSLASSPRARRSRCVGGSASGSGRRASSRKKTMDSPSPSPSPLLLNNTTSFNSVERSDEEDEEEYRAPKLPGDEPDFWEGPQWDTVGFIMQYLWAFGIVFAVVACGVAVRTYNYGATDFKETPVYKEAIESRGLFEEALETPDSQEFEINPTEVTPSP